MAINLAAFLTDPFPSSTKFSALPDCGISFVTRELRSSCTRLTPVTVSPLRIALTPDRAVEHCFMSADQFWLSRFPAINPAPLQCDRPIISKRRTPWLPACMSPRKRRTRTTTTTWTIRKASKVLLA